MGAERRPESPAGHSCGLHIEQGELSGQNVTSLGGCLFSFFAVPLLFPKGVHGGKLRFLRVLCVSLQIESTPVPGALPLALTPSPVQMPCPCSVATDCPLVPVCR